MVKARKPVQDKNYYLWREIRDEIFRRDKWTCYRCDKKFPRKRDLSVHHIIPRSDGGGDNFDNLVTLCHPCHDYVEIYGLKNRAEISGSYEGRIVVRVIEPDIEANSEIDKNRPDWHKYVYGGCKRQTV